ncbi:hypothetical protein S40288_09901 [Stachybotrys chartarum IBT 40288]|nr:hypothetical protein S40288_09901 [Stachybotrys chartarum IBT 40288]
MAFREAFTLTQSAVKAATPPGTVVIVDYSNPTTRDEHTIVKVPLPSNSPRDPLNYETWRKITALVVVSIYAFVANFTSSVIAPALQLWPLAFPRDPQPYHVLSYPIAYHVLFLGISSLIWVPLANWMGKRPVLILATLLMTVCSVWCSLATSYDSLLAARILQAVGGGAADTVAPALVGDLFFVHQRGRAMGLYTALLCTGPFFGGLVGGYIAFGHGWASIFWVSTALSAFTLLGVVLVVPETMFSRHEYLRQQELESQAAQHSASKDEARVIGIERPEVGTTEKLSSWETLAFRKPRGSLWQQYVRILRAMHFPATWVITLHYAGLIGGVVTIATVGPYLVSHPPYLWGPNAGLINVGGIIGTILGYVYTHVTSDSLLKRRAKSLREGVSEAEDRLPTLFFPLALAACGLLVFGFCAQYPGTNRWVGLEVGFAMLSFGLMQVPSVGFSYLIDSYHSLAADCFTVVTIARSLISFAWTFCVTQWVEDRGAAEPFGIFGMLLGLFALFTFPLWLWGKRSRIATAHMVETWGRV